MKDAGHIAQLAPLACAGDREAVGQIVEATRSRLLAVAYAQLNDREDALDAVASALVQICHKVNQVRDPARIEAWMQAIVRREARQLRRTRVPLLTLGDHLHPSYRVETTSQLHLDLERALRVLPAHQEQAMRLHYGQQLSAREIADHFGVAEGTVKMWLHRARRFLARELEGYEPMTATTTPTTKALPVSSPLPDFTNPDWSVPGAPEDARYAGILHDNLPQDLLDALKAGLTAGGYIPVPATWGDFGTSWKRMGHAYIWAKRLSLLVLDETVGGMLGIVPLLHFKNPRTPIPVPTCLFYSLKLSFNERDAFAIAGVEHFLRKDKPYDIANFARPFRRRRDSTTTAKALEQAIERAMEIAAKHGKNTMDTLDFLFALFPSEESAGTSDDEPAIAVRVLNAFGLSGAAVRDAVAPLLTHGPGHDRTVAVTSDKAGDAVGKNGDAERDLLLDDQFDTEHLLLGLLRTEDDPAGRVLRDLGMNLEAAREIVRQLRGLPPPLLVP